MKACGTIGAIDEGKVIYNETVSRGLINMNIMFGTSLVDVVSLPKHNMFLMCFLFEMKCRGQH